SHRVTAKWKPKRKSRPWPTPSSVKPSSPPWTPSSAAPGQSPSRRGASSRTSSDAGCRRPRCAWTERWSMSGRPAQTIEAAVQAADEAAALEPEGTARKVEAQAAEVIAKVEALPAPPTVEHRRRGRHDLVGRGTARQHPVGEAAHRPGSGPGGPQTHPARQAGVDGIRTPRQMPGKGRKTVRDCPRSREL